MYVYPDSRAVEIYPVDSWLDITEYVLGNISAGFGFSTAKPDIRIADAAVMSLTLNNVGKQFSPDGGATIAGWTKGIKIRVSVTFRGASRVVWAGRITDIDLDTAPYGTRQAQIIASNWMDTAAKYPLPPLAISTNKRADEGITETLATMDIPPAATNFDEGIDTFPTVHDSLIPGDVAYSELNRLALSEFGFVYLRRDKTYAETLRFEKRSARDARTDVAVFPKPAEDSSILITEAGDTIITEDGDTIVLDELQEASFDNNANDMRAEYGKKIYNDVTFRYYPRRVDTSPVVLAVTNTRVQLIAGATEKIRLSYVDPTGGGATANLSSVDALTAGMTANSDGTGADLTASLTVTPDYGANYAEFELENTGGTDGWVNLSLSAYGIYFYNAIEINERDLTSILANGIEQIVVNQKYQQYAGVAGPLAEVILSRFKDPITIPSPISFVANKSVIKMLMFLYLDTGDLVPVKNTQTNVDGFYFIHGGEFVITPGGIITVSYYMTDALSTSDAYWELETVGAGELEISTIIGV